MGNQPDDFSKCPDPFNKIRPQNTDGDTFRESGVDVESKPKEQIYSFNQLHLRPHDLSGYADPSTRIRPPTSDEAIFRDRGTDGEIGLEEKRFNASHIDLRPEDVDVEIRCGKGENVLSL